MTMILIRGAKQLLTLRGTRSPRRGREMQDLGIVSDGALLIVDGILQEVGPTRRVENLAIARGAREIDATGCVVMPGLVDAHTHLLYPPFHAGATGWGEAQSPGMENVTAKRLEHRGRQFVEAMARHGTTTLEAVTAGLDEAGETKLLRAIAALNGESIDVGASLTARVGELSGRSDWFCGEWMPKVKRRRLARAVDLLWDGDPGTSAVAERVAAEAARLRLRLRVHHEGPGPEPLRLGIRAGAATCDHLEHATDEDIAAVAGSGAVAVLAPAHAFHAHRGQYAPARALVDAGCAVALATDFNPLLSPTLSMTAAIWLACSRTRLAAAEAICAATFNAAGALGCAARIGSLECGKAADVVVLEVADYREIARSLGHNLVSMTIKRGAVIYEQGQVARRSGLRPVA
jgi:imidazolonepropionase